MSPKGIGIGDQKRETRFRLLTIGGLVSGGALASLIFDRPEILWAVLLIAAIQACMLGLVYTWGRWGKHLFAMDNFALATDVVSITLGLHFLGGVEFPFDWIYAVYLSAISITRGLRTGLILAQWSIICYGTLVWAEYSGTWPHMALFPIFVRAPLYNDPDYVLTKLFSNAAMFNVGALTAALFSGTIRAKVAERTRELQQAQVQLLHSQKLATLGQMAASLAHGLASPITGIKGSAELLMDDLPPNHPGQRRLEQILHWSDHLSDILERLRNLGRPTKEDRVPVQVNQVVGEVLDLAAKLLSQHHIQVQRAFAPDLPQIMGSARMLEEMFMNLVMNAKDAMLDGGKLTVITRREGVTNGGSVAVDLQDTGVGMSREVKRRIFEAFFTTKGERGSGLGLNICRQIVVDHGGQLSVESEEGVGSTFTVRLPVAER